MTSLSSSEILAEPKPHSAKPDLNRPMSMKTVVVLLAVLALGLFFTAFSIFRDIQASGTPVNSVLPFLLLALALLIALGFEFVNGFHDTANAVATVIYTHSLAPSIAVVWSGFFNFLGVLFSTGAVAFGIVSLLPVELILQVGSDAGFAMVFAMLIAAIIWNLGTWWLGLPASSSHTLIGSIIGVGVANALMRGRDGTAGVDWGKATEIGYALLLSPAVGFFAAGLLLLTMKVLIRRPELYSEPKANAAPPLWIRGLLIFTSAGVSFAHGSNDGQKGMGLIMLILIGTVPTAYALNRALPESQIVSFIENSAAASKVVETVAGGHHIIGDPRPAVTAYVASHEFNEGTLPSLAVLIRDIASQIQQYGSIAAIPAATVGNTRNDMYLASEAIRVLQKDKASDLSKADLAVLANYKKGLDSATKFIPDWVKVSVAIALGLGTMIGWKRIVITVGEKIGKTHLTYGQGAAAEIVAMATIGAADSFGLPVSTTHVLSSGVAGTMAANGSGVQMSTIRSLALAWVLTLPCAIALSALLFFIFRHLF
ncbi:phosphate transporter [Methylocella silvestris BL2]|uniref:Phosphate transporter n=1 Tax=Methylocella silvestris (strain DSM 15510 / CIP 108128 / LMG 27833 / NCIMB 13906 / BL2) TaxID=395965 RepID=B8EK76_METSB|nr:inorganic phosphate transporter [Methylocella silvestris]ACK50616.1 phosphate transporter [Methylocella silvestris BL2]